MARLIILVLCVLSAIADGAEDSVPWYRPLLSGIYDTATGVVKKVGNAFNSVVMSIAQFPMGIVAKSLIKSVNNFISCREFRHIDVEEMRETITDVGEIVATNGRIGDMATLALEGDVELNEVNSSYILSVPLKLKVFEVVYKTLEIRTITSLLTGNLTIRFEDNSLLIRISVRSGQCFLSLEKFSLERLEGMTLQAGGTAATFLEDIVGMVETVVERLREGFQDKVKEKVQAHLDTILVEFFKDHKGLLSTILCGQLEKAGVSEKPEDIVSSSTTEKVSD